MMKLGSEGVYLHEKCGTNPSRHLPGLNTAIKNKKNPILGSRGFGVLGSRGVRGFDKLPIQRPYVTPIPLALEALDF